MSDVETPPRSLWLVAGILLVLAGAGAVTFGLLDDGVPPDPDAGGVQRADTRLGFLLGGLLGGAVGLVLVYRATT